MTNKELNDNALAVLKATQCDIAWLEHKRNLLIPYLRLAAGNRSGREGDRPSARSFIVSQIEELDMQIAALYAALSCVNHPSNVYYYDTYTS